MSGRRYAPEYKARMVELVRAGRGADQLAREFEPLGDGDPALGGAGRPGRGASHQRSDDG